MQDYNILLFILKVALTVWLRSSRKLQQEFPNLGKQYWGKHFWAVGYGAFSAGEVTDKIIKIYLENHDTKNDSDDGFVVE